MNQTISNHRKETLKAPRAGSLSLSCFFSVRLSYGIPSCQHCTNGHVATNTTATTTVLSIATFIHICTHYIYTLPSPLFSLHSSFAITSSCSCSLPRSLRCGHIAPPMTDRDQQQPTTSHFNVSFVLSAVRIVSHHVFNRLSVV